MNFRDIPYSGGFVFTCRDYDAVSHFHKTELPGGWRFWCDTSKWLSKEVGEDGSFILVYGHWADTSREDNITETLAADLLASRRTGSSKFEEHLDFLAGRFVIIVNYNGITNVYHDAIGLRSVYYSTSNPLVSSHLNLLAELTSSREIYDRKAISLAMDFTEFDGIRQLLPNFTLNMGQLEVERFFPREPNKFSSLSVEDRLREVELLWNREISTYVDNFPQIAISVTGGLDSRLMLAMSRKFWPKLNAFTYGLTEGGSGNWSKVMNNDFRIVSKFINLLNLGSYQFIDLSQRRKVSEGLRSLLSRNSRVPHGPYLMPSYRDIFPGDDWLHIRGTGVEIVRRYFGGSTNFANVLRMCASEDGPEVTDRGRYLGYDDTFYDYLNKDLVYWELRMGKWHSEVVNENDAAFDTLLPISVRRIYELLLSFPEQDRVDAYAIEELINRNADFLNFYGKNDVRNVYEQNRDEFRSPLPGKDVHNITNIRLENAAGEMETLVPTSGQELVFPRDSFSRGNRIVGHLYKVTRPGALSLTVRQPFVSQRGVGYFSWELRVNGSSQLECDGAVSSLPVHATIEGLNSGDIVEVSILANRDVARAESWETASKLRIHDLEFYPVVPRENQELTVLCDSRHASVRDIK